MKDQIHSPLIGSTYILQSKCHHNPLKEINKHRTYEGCLGHVLFCHKKIIITGITIQKADNPMSQSVVSKHIGCRRRILIFRSSSIHISKIH
jgi:hypothetical protein